MTTTATPTPDATAPFEDAPSRIGPNAIIRVAEALTEACGDQACAEVFAAAGLSHYLAEPPIAMVDEAEVTALQQALWAGLAPEAAEQVAWTAGVKTGDYVMAHRIPKPAQALLKVLPAPLASRLFLPAIARHAWTFAGSGQFTAAAGQPVRITIAGCPVCRGQQATAPRCAYYAGTFERLFRVLVTDRARARQTACTAAGAPACSFEIAW